MLVLCASQTPEEFIWKLKKRLAELAREYQGLPDSKKSASRPRKQESLGKTSQRGGRYKVSTEQSGVL